MHAASIEYDFVFMEDSTRLHCDGLVDKFFFNEGVLRIDWSAYYTNLNFIEHVCVNDFSFLIIHTNNTANKKLE